MCILTVFIKFGHFWTIISPSILSASFSFFSFWDSHYAYIDTFDNIPQTSEDLFLFLYPFSFLFIRRNNLIYPVLQFSDSLFCHFKCAVEPLHGIFHLSYCTFQIQNFYLIFFFFLIQYLVRYCSHTFLQYFRHDFV